MMGEDDGRGTRDKEKLDRVSCMEMGASGLGSLSHLILLRGDDTTMHAASRTEIIHGYSSVA